MAKQSNRPYVSQGVSYPVQPEQRIQDSKKGDKAPSHNVRWHDKDYHDKITLSGGKIQAYGNTHITIHGKKGE